MNKIDIRDLYIAELGKFQYCKYIVKTPYLEYIKLKPNTFYYKHKNYFIDIFSGKKFIELKAETVKKDEIGLINPKKCTQLFLDSTVKQIDKDSMFSLDELKSIAKLLKKDIVYGSIKTEAILLERVLGTKLDIEL